jgi:hypothetical protein
MGEYRHYFIRQLSAFTSSQLAHSSHVGHSSYCTQWRRNTGEKWQAALMLYNKGPVLYAFCSRQHSVFIMCACTGLRSGKHELLSFSSIFLTCWSLPVPQGHEGMQQQDTLYVAHPTCTVLTFPPHVSKHSLFTLIKALQNDLVDSDMFLTAAEQTIKYTLDNYTLRRPDGCHYFCPDCRISKWPTQRETNITR